MVFSIILTELDSDVSTHTNTIYTPVLWPPNAKSQLEKTLMLGKTEDRRRRGDRG